LSEHLLSIELLGFVDMIQINFLPLVGPSFKNLDQWSLAALAVSRRATSVVRCTARQ
jgi:hypothetical protein